ncbi:uncharacterized protein LOC111307754 isoform X2 [Durio zibethinus]|uniref:Uncharacterized protein LOC111307754 isoform X2 n=1 Tax=Durio zibethinus TaxID=66656 RepID=A0A6P6AA24_DURZI|nr:uncharacterized protein LOC111307754 isoform X2 [Durio zibethinus]
MADKEYQGFNHSLSRKELQSVCKKYGLPANRSSSDMAKSLASYLENQRLGSMTAEERLYGTQEDGLPLSLKLQLQPEASLNSFRDAGKDCYGLISCPIDRCNEGNYSQAVECNALGCCTVDKFYHKIPMPEDVVLQKNALHSPRENGGFVDLVDPKHNTYAEQGGIVGSTELDQETFRTRLPTLVEEQGRSKIINWGKSSECSQDELFENCGERDNVGSNGLGKKRAYIDGDQNDCSVLDAKILRSTKHLIMKVLPRRSMRLVSKIPSFFREQVFTQRHNKVTKGCRERDNEEVLFLKMAIELVKADQESTKQRWCGLLMRLFQPECFDIGKLGSFILEQEVYDLMSAKRDDELKILMAEIEGFIRPMVERNKKVNELMMELNRIPKKSNFTRWNLGQYGDDEPSSPHPDQGFKNSSIGDMGRSLSEVVVEMYGFPPDVALDIQESAATGNLVGEASENASMSDDDLDRKGEGFDPLEYLDHQVFSENCELEDAETLNWKSVRIAKQKLEDLNMKI